METQQETPAVCAYEDCDEPRWDGSADGYCLYHAPENGRDKDTATRVWDEARSRAQAGNCDFTGWRFPNDPRVKGFTHITFSADASFDRATFAGGVLAEKVTFSGNVGFSEAVFRANADFPSASFDRVALFESTTFYGKVAFESARFHSLSIFSNATFKGYVGFAGAIFRLNAMFDGVTFRSDARFRKAVFLDVAYFHDAVFCGSAEFPTKCEGVLDIPLPSWRLDHRPPFLVSIPFRHRGEGETAYRLAKQSAQDRGDYRAAGHYHYWEQCAIGSGRRRRYGLKPWHPLKFLHCWLEFIFARGLFGYGEKPGRVLAAGVLVILLCAGLFDVHNGIVGLESPCPLTALYFSAVTFTTLGYGDFEPTPDMRWLAGAEAFAGAALMALFIVTLARKYTR